jgi:MFS family permease
MNEAGDRRVVNTLLGAEGVTRVGDAVTVVALPLVAVLVLDASAGELALIGAAQALPILLLSLPAGAWVDRQRRRWPILVSADLARAALIILVPIAAAIGLLSIPLLIVIAFLSSAAGTMFDAGFAGWVPRLLAGDRLHLANARIELARSVAAVVGPALGGALVALFSAPVALLADAVSFVASGGLVASIRRREPSWAPATENPRMLRQIASGLSFVAREPLIRAVVATAGINNLSRAVAMSVAILYLVDVGGLSAAEIGIGFAIGHTGYMVGALVARRLTSRLGMGAVMQLGIGLFGPSMLLFALAPATLALAAFTLMVFLNGVGIAVHNVNQVTVRQILTPDALRARVAAVTRLVIFGAIPVGTLIGGVVAELYGLRTAIALGAAGLFIGSLPYLLVRVTSLRTVDQLQPADA